MIMFPQVFSAQQQLQIHFIFILDHKYMNQEWYQNQGQNGE